MTETASACGSVFLPVASSLEKEGTFMNAERRIQRVRQVLPPPAEARADWQIVRELARRYGVAQHFEADSPAAIWEEIRSVWPAVAGIDYARMEQGGVQWPCPDAAHPGSSVLHQEAFGRSRTAKLECIDYVPSDEQTSSEFPFLLITGRTLHQFNAGTMIARTPNHQLRPEDTLDISAADAASLGLSTAERVRVRSPYGEAVLPLRVSASMKVGELFATFHDAHRGVNRLTSAVRDRLVGAPEYKLTAVRLEPVAGGGPPDRQAAPHRGN
jgi:formate dehydrogenase major subunit